MVRNPLVRSRQKQPYKFDEIMKTKVNLGKYLMQKS